MATNCIEILSSSESETERKGVSDVEVVNFNKENQPPTRSSFSGNSKRQSAPSSWSSEDSDFEVSRNHSKVERKPNTTHVQRGENTKSANVTSPNSTYDILEGMEFDSFEVLETHADKYAANVGMRWLRSTATKDRGPNKEFIVQRLLCQSCENTRMMKGSKGIRRVGSSIKCGCTAAILVYEHKVTKKCTVKKAQLLHSYPCVPG